MMLSIFLFAQQSFIYLLWRNVCSNYLPTCKMDYLSFYCWVAFTFFFHAVFGFIMGMCWHQGLNKPQNAQPKTITPFREEQGVSDNISVLVNRDTAGGRECSWQTCSDLSDFLTSPLKSKSSFLPPQRAIPIVLNSTWLQRRTSLL